MPFALLIIGAVLLVSAARGTVASGPNGGPGLFTLVESDFTGQNNFIFWFVSILLIGAVGYVPKLKPLSIGFLTLVIMVLFLKKGNPSGAGGGFFAQVLQGVGSTQSASPSVNQAASAIAGQPLQPSLSTALSAAPGLSGLLGLEGDTTSLSTLNQAPLIGPASDNDNLFTPTLTLGGSGSSTASSSAGSDSSSIFTPSSGGLSFPALGIS
jgi:hypothetical protein